MRNLMKRCVIIEDDGHKYPVEVCGAVHPDDDKLILHSQDMKDEITRDTLFYMLCIKSWVGTFTVASLPPSSFLIERFKKLKGENFVLSKSQQNRIRTRLLDLDLIAPAYGFGTYCQPQYSTQEGTPLPADGLTEDMKRLTSPKGLRAYQLFDIKF